MMEFEIQKITILTILDYTHQYVSVVNSFSRAKYEQQSCKKDRFPGRAFVLVHLNQQVDAPKDKWNTGYLNKVANW